MPDIIDTQLERFMPHASPMILIDKIIAYTNDSVHAAVTIHQGSMFFANGAVPSYVAIEYMAQAIAAWNGLVNQDIGQKPPVGFLLGSRNIILDVADFKENDQIDIYCKVSYMADEIGCFTCQLAQNSTIVATAMLNVFQPQNLTTHLENTAHDN
jgi:predicted hotdog family 3-hydroxylacyl-ACP dehydratase